MSYVHCQHNNALDTEVLPPVAKKHKQLSIANFCGGASNAGPSRNAEVVQVERKTPTPNYVGQDRLVFTDDQDIAVALSWRLAGTLGGERKLHCINSTLKAGADYVGRRGEGIRGEGRIEGGRPNIA